MPYLSFKIKFVTTDYLKYVTGGIFLRYISVCET